MASKKRLVVDLTLLLLALIGGGLLWFQRREAPSTALPVPTATPQVTRLLQMLPEAAPRPTAVPERLSLDARAADEDAEWRLRSSLLPADPGLKLSPGMQYARVSYVAGGSSADAAQLQTGDLVLEVDGLRVDGLTQDELQALMMGEDGSSLQLLMLLEVESGQPPREVLVTLERSALDL